MPYLEPCFSWHPEATACRLSSAACIASCLHTTPCIVRHGALIQSTFMNQRRWFGWQADGFGSPFVWLWLCSSLKNGPLKWLASLPALMQTFWWWHRGVGNSALLQLISWDLGPRQCLFGDHSALKRVQRQQQQPGPELRVCCYAVISTESDVDDNPVLQSVRWTRRQRGKWLYAFNCEPEEQRVLARPP